MAGWKRTREDGFDRTTSGATAMELGTESRGGTTDLSVSQLDKSRELGRMQARRYVASRQEAWT